MFTESREIDIYVYFCNKGVYPFQCRQYTFLKSNLKRTITYLFYYLIEPFDHLDERNIDLLQQYSYLIYLSFWKEALTPCGKDSEESEDEQEVGK